MTMNKIALSARYPGSGKDTVARYLEIKYGYKKVSFASKIYSIARNLFGMDKKDRALLQEIGQKMREIDSKVWIKCVENKIKTNNFDKVVISDLRQANELEWAIKNGFTPVRIEVDKEVAVNRIIERDGECKEERFDHESEKGVESVKMKTIYNNGSRQDLYKKIDSLMKECGG